MGVERVEVRAKGGEYLLVNNDCVDETQAHGQRQRGA
jgi:hypothetical protein